MSGYARSPSLYAAGTIATQPSNPTAVAGWYPTRWNAVYSSSAATPTIAVTRSIAGARPAKNAMTATSATTPAVRRRGVRSTGPSSWWSWCWSYSSKWSGTGGPSRPPRFIGGGVCIGGASTGASPRSPRPRRPRLPPRRLGGGPQASGSPCSSPCSATPMVSSLKSSPSPQSPSAQSESPVRNRGPAAPARSDSSRCSRRPRRSRRAPGAPRPSRARSSAGGSRRPTGSGRPPPRGGRRRRAGRSHLGHPAGVRDRDRRRPTTRRRRRLAGGTEVRELEPRAVGLCRPLRPRGAGASAPCGAYGSSSPTTRTPSPAPCGVQVSSWNSSSRQSDTTTRVDPKARRAKGLRPMLLKLSERTVDHHSARGGPKKSNVCSLQLV